MNRRRFLSLLAGVPFLAKVLPEPVGLTHSSGWPPEGSRSLMVKGYSGALIDSPRLEDADWIMYDPYESWPPRPHTVHVYTGDQGFYKWATDPAPGKPIMLGEWGIDL